MLPFSAQFLPELDTAVANKLGIRYKIYPVGIKYDQSIEKSKSQHAKIYNAEAKDSANRSMLYCREFVSVAGGYFFTSVSKEGFCSSIQASKV